MRTPTGAQHALTAATVETCRFRRPAPPAADQDEADCSLLGELLSGIAPNESGVARAVCEACCRSFPPTGSVMNPVIGSLVYRRAGSHAYGDRREAAQALMRRAEKFLDVAAPAAAAPAPATSGPQSEASRLRDALSAPRKRCGSRVRHWGAGVTTSPRRQATLERCLDSLNLAGWPEPLLLADGPVRLESRFSSLPYTVRDEPVGAWPHYHLSLSELLMREPHADAYLLVQDDALFFDRENLREYLEDVLWPGSEPPIVSLYWGMGDVQQTFEWRMCRGPWDSGAVALVFPREIAVELVLDRDVFAHRRSPGGNGLVGICDVIEAWAQRRKVPLYYPTLSLVQHIGATSAIWSGSGQLTPARRAACFAGDIIRNSASRESPALEPIRVSAGAPSDSRDFRLDRSAAAFPEGEFPCPGRAASAYAARVGRGRDRMRDASAVICGLCRDVVHCLPATAARIERLAEMFGRCQTVIFENDSKDSTLRWLQQWSAANPAVHVVNERLDSLTFSQVGDRERTARMAHYRNRCREAVLSMFPDYDCVIVLDADLEGGWSYDGIAHTFGDADWDFVGSYGIWYEPDAEGKSFRPVHYDAFAFRRAGCVGLEDFQTVNEMAFRRGDALVRLWSCFGGLGVYRMECYRSAAYAAFDCEHVAFHHALRLLGFDRLFLNPSQIVLYTPLPHRRGQRD